MTVKQAKKVIGIPLQKFLRDQDGFLLVRGFVTTDEPDEVGDVITREATRKAIPKYRRWGNIRYMHQPKPVGKVVRIGEEDGLAWNEVEIKVVDPQAIFEIEQGLLQALSVGILVDLNKVDRREDGGWVIHEYKLAEISLVDHPANYGARLTNIDEGLRERMRSEGVVPVMLSLGMGELLMDCEEKSEEIVVEQSEPAEEEQEKAPPAETEEQVQEEQPVEKEMPEEELQPTVPADPYQAVREEIEKFSREMNAWMENVLKQLQAVAEQVQVVYEASMASKALAQAEVQEAQPEVQPEASEEVAEDATDEIRKELAALKETVAQLMVPAERKGALPVDEVEEPEVVEKPKSLREAIFTYFGKQS